MSRKRTSKNSVTFPEIMWEVICRAAKAYALPPDLFVLSVMADVVRQTVQDERKVAEAAAVPAGQPKPSIELPIDVERSNGHTGFAGVYPNGNRYKAMLHGIVLGTY